jgi:predicted AAA+ superfamily ATPase
MDSGLVRDYVLEWLGKAIEDVIERDLQITSIASRATVIVGPRRAGKTYFLYQMAKKTKRDEVLYLNFEDSRLRTLHYGEIREVIRLAVELTAKEPKTLMLDEIQNIENWEVAVRELLDLKTYTIFITGSSSKMLSKEVATQLRGRSLTYLMLPFSFSEYLRAMKKDSSIEITRDKAARIKNSLSEYLEWGGFPEVVLESKNRELILKEYYELILFKDIIERNSMKNIPLARFLLEQLLQNFSKEISVNGIMKKAEGISLSKDTTYDYVDKMQDSAAIFFLGRFSPKARTRESWPKKVYACDTGLTKVVKFSSDMGKLIENCVFLELTRQTNKRPFLKLFYWKGRLGDEVDFVLKESDRVTELIQVTYASSKSDIDKRETRSLVSGSDEFKCKKLTIITWDYKAVLKLGKRTIECIPLWEWLLAKPARAFSEM